MVHEFVREHVAISGSPTTSGIRMTRVRGSWATGTSTASTL
ncbi:hypothetical protein AB0L59_18085 [Streptomyces sp. NPDC052109]